MITRTLSILGLALCATAGAMAPGLATPSLAAPTTPTIAVTEQVSTSYLPGSYQTVVLHRLTLHITGSGFTPGSKVRIAVMNTAPWKLLAKGSTYAQPSVVLAGVCAPGHEGCSRPNPRAGTIDYRMRFSYVPAASNLVVLYRSAQHTGIHDLTLTQQ
jgi:hypothetical protein